MPENLADIAVTPDGINLRAATREDTQLVFEWRNRPEIVARGSSHRTVEWEEHQHWFEASLDQEDERLLFILELAPDAIPGGLVRFDRSAPREAVISVYVLDPHTGRGWGTRAIREGVRRLQRVWILDKVVACVREDNDIGRRAFIKCGFVESEADSQCPDVHRKFVLDLSVLEILDEDERNIRSYTDLVREHGISSRALDWGSRASQTLRFRILAEIGVKPGERVLDAGCGQGDLYEWLQAQHSGIDYTGFDITPAMVETARERFPEARFETADAASWTSSDIDYAFCSGLFAYRPDGGIDYQMMVISRLFEQVKSGVAFNSLSGWAPTKVAGEYYADPQEVLTRCRALTSRVVLRHDYHPNDFTIYLYKPA